MRYNEEVPIQDVLIRPATPEDAAAVAVLMTELGYTTSADQMCARLGRFLSNPDYETFVAELNGAVVGAAGACVAALYEDDLPLGRIAALCVAEHARGRGIGAKLMVEAEDWLRCKGVGSIAVISGTHRTEAHRFYEARGYEVVGLSLRKAPH